MSIRELLDAATRNLYGRTLAEAHDEGTCIRCSRAVTGLSAADEAEYRLSGFCPECWVWVFPDDACE